VDDTLEMVSGASRVRAASLLTIVSWKLVQFENNIQKHQIMLQQSPGKIIIIWSTIGDPLSF